MAWHLLPTEESTCTKLYWRLYREVQRGFSAHSQHLTDPPGDMAPSGPITAGWEGFRLYWPLRMRGGFSHGDSDLSQLVPSTWVLRMGCFASLDLAMLLCVGPMQTSFPPGGAYLVFQETPPFPPPRKTISSKTFLLGHSPCSLGSLHLSWGVEHCGLLAGSLLISPQVPRLLGESVWQLMSLVPCRGPGSYGVFKSRWH